MPVARGFQHHGMNMSFDVVDADQRNIAGERQGFGVSDAHQQRTNQSWPGGYGDGRKVR